MLSIIIKATDTHANNSQRECYMKLFFEVLTIVGFFYILLLLVYYGWMFFIEKQTLEEIDSHFKWMDY